MSETTITIRLATEADLAVITQLHYGLLQEDGKRRDPFMNAEWPREESLEFHQGFIDTEGKTALVAEISTQVVGFVVGWVSGPSSLYPIIRAELISMFVQSNHRNSGVGGALVDRFVDWAKEQNAATIRVSAFAANTDAIRFYLRQGFSPKNVVLEHQIAS